MPLPWDNCHGLPLRGGLKLAMVMAFYRLIDSHFISDKSNYVSRLGTLVILN